MKDLKLKIELVPKKSWYDNLRAVMSRGDWEKLSRQTKAEYGHKCGICGSDEGRLYCHEVWEYDDENHKQTLKGFITLCFPCHMIKHIGYAGSQPNIDFESLVDHFMKVNNCNKETFNNHYHEAFEIWRKRSRRKWDVDLGEYASLVR